MSKVGFIGLGSIGFPIAENISKKGNEVYCYARRPEVVEQARECGMIPRETIMDLGKEDLDCVLLFVSTYGQCMDCITELLQTMKNGIIVIGSTISPINMREIHSYCSEKGVKTLDAPVSGGVAGAKAGTLVSMVSGDAETLASIEDVINSYSKKIVYAGDEVGKGESLKAIVQLLVCISTVATSEAIGLSQKMGLDSDMVIDVVLNSSGSSKIFENRSRTIVDGDFSKRGNNSTMLKDITICNEIASELDYDLYLGKVCRSLFTRCMEELDPEEDFSSVYKLYMNERSDES